MIQSAEKSSLQKTWELYYLEKIMKASKTIHFNRRYQNRMTFLGAQRLIAITLSYMKELNIKISLVSNAAKSIA